MPSINKEEIFRKLPPELQLISAGIWFSLKNLRRYKRKADPRSLRILKECQSQYATELKNHKAHEVSVSPLWQKVLDSIQLQILGFDNPHQALRFGQTKTRFDHRSNIASYIHDIPLQAAHLRVEFPQFASMISNASDSEFSCPETMIRYKGRLISNMLYFHLRYVLQCLRNVEQPQHICEIGGGYGGPARLWFTNPVFNPKSYVIIDFPEALFFANLFLKMSLPDVQVIYLDGTSTLTKLPEKSIVLCPIHLLEKLKGLHFDLMINTGSLQEMTEEAVDYWMDWIEKSNARCFYSLNYFSQPLAHLAEGCSLWSTRLSNRWAYRMNRANPYFIKSQTTRNFGEIFAERLQSPIRLDRSAILERCNDLTSLAFDEQAFMDLLDLVRITQDSEFIWIALQAAVKKMSYIPKEALYLSGMLMKMKPGNIPIAELNQIHSHLMNIHTKSTTNYG